MYLRCCLAALVFAAGCAACTSQAPAAHVATHQFFRVHLGPASTKPESGRLLLFALNAKDAQPDPNGVVASVDANPFRATESAVAAQEVSYLPPGRNIDVDTGELSYPKPFAQLQPGDYYVQAVLDVDHSYAYSGRGAGDLVSDVVKMHLPSDGMPELALTRTLPAGDPWELPAGASADERAALPAARQHASPIDFVSPSLTAFWGRPITMRGRVLTPPDYEAKASTRYPTVYYTQGFGGNNDRVVPVLVYVYAAMARGEMPPMIWVFLDESGPTGTHEFADSVNNGPWGQALTTELIPELESRYRMDGRAGSRFLNGHSSGGWATLWLQTRYPKVFGGTWSTAPDSSDFHDFTGVDIYAPDANVYRKPDGSAYPLVRNHDKVLASFEQFAKLERVLGSYGGQMSSFDWVFSPRGKDGRPEPMFDRDTGAVDADVAAYWRDHYDIAHRLQQDWPQLKPDLDGKIHLIVGTADTFYLDGAAHKLKAVLDGLHAKSDFRFLPDRTHHGDLYTIGDDKRGLLKQISWEMYAQARPDSKLKPPAAPSPAASSTP